MRDIQFSSEFPTAGLAGPTLAQHVERAEAPAATVRIPLRIVMVTPRYFPEIGGVETHVHELSRRLVALGHSVVVVATDRSRRLPADDISAGVKVRRVKAWPRRRDYHIAPGIVREIMRGDFDIVHVQGCHTFVPPLAMMAALAKGVPYIVTFHSGGHSSRLRNRMRGLQWRTIAPLVRQAARCIGVSRFEADYFSRTMRVPRSEFEVIANGAQMPVQEACATPAVDPLIVSIGRLERYKGHHRAIEAFSRLLIKRPHTRLRVLGDGPYEHQLRSLVHELGLEARVEIGSIPPAQRHSMAALLSSASLVVLLSDYEAHPVAVAEALALGRPVLATDCSGFREMAEQGLIRTVPLDAGASHIADAMHQEMDRVPGGTFELPTWDACTGRVLEVYRSVVGA